MSRASMAVCWVERPPASSVSKRTSWPTLGGRETCCWLAGRRSSFARVALRGTEPLRKFRRPFGLMEIAAAARRNDIRAVSRPTASRNSGTGSAGTLRRPGLILAVHFVRYCGIYTVRSEEHTSELQSRLHLVCRLLLEKKKKQIKIAKTYTVRIVR